MYNTTLTTTKPGNGSSLMDKDGFHLTPGDPATLSLLDGQAESKTKNQENGVTTTKGSRVKRFAYEDEHEWPDDDNMDYDLDDDGDEDDLSLADRIGKHWQTVAVRGLFYLVGVCMLGFICCCCGTVCCRVCCHSLRQNCVPCAGFLKFISAYYEDPMYTRAKEMAAMFGLKLDYDTFMKIKDRFDMGSEGQYNPLGLPHMS